MVARQFARDRRHTKSIRYNGTLEVRSRRVAIAVEFPVPNLARLPRLYLIDRVRDLPDAVAHVEENDRICYAREEELVLDPLNPRGSVALCMLKMQETLDRIARDDLRDEVAQEFPQHWRGASIYVDLAPEAKKAIAFTVSREGGNLNVVAESAKSLERMGLAGADIKAAERTGIPVVLLRTDRALTFTHALRVPSVLAELLAWLSSAGNELPKALIAGMARNWPKESVFFLIAPNGIVGGKLVIPRALAKAVQRSQFLAQLLERRASEIVLERLTGVTLDPEFIYRRNMASQPNLGGKRIALVGVGTIGGWLARFLAQSGAGTSGGALILLDEQLLQPGNLGRHWLGISYVGVNKATAARGEMARTNPDCNVVSIPETALKHMPMLMECDLVIDATGEQALSDVLNVDFVKTRHEGAKAPVSLHVWLVGSGVAARAILVDRPGHACFRCLRLDHGIERFRLINPSHPVALTPANCGEGAYFAYGVGAPAVAAGLALQMSLDWVKGAPSPRHRTIRINHEAAFYLKDANAPALENCPACSFAHG
jgi:molybdopterin/thiamine biosynthesis adenylyltransferase